MLALGAAALWILGDAYSASLFAPASILAVAAVAGISAILAAPGLLVACVPATIIFNTQRGFFPFELVGFTLLAYAALDALWRRDARLPGPAGLHAAWLAFILAASVTLFQAVEPVAFLGGMMRLVLGYGAMAFVLRYAGRRLWPWFALSIPLAGVAVSLQLLQAYLARGFDVRKAFLLRTFFSDLGWGVSNYVGAVLALCLLATVIVLLLTRLAWLRLACVAALVPMTAGVLMLVSRGTVVAVGCGLLALALFTRGTGRWRVVAVAALVALAFFQSPISKITVARFTTGAQAVSYVARVRLWQDALSRFASHPLTGVGLGQGTYQLDALQKFDPHSYFLSVATETGILGLLAWIALIWTLLRSPWKNSEGSPTARGWAAGLIVLTLIAVFHSSYEPTFTGPQYHFLFFWIYAVLFRVTDPRAEAGVEDPD
jgi:O-antigen ligase